MRQFLCRTPALISILSCGLRSRLRESKITPAEKVFGLVPLHFQQGQKGLFLCHGRAAILSKENKAGGCMCVNHTVACPCFQYTGELHISYFFFISFFLYFPCFASFSPFRETWDKPQRQLSKPALQC